MRSINSIYGNEIIKKVSCSPELGVVIKTRIGDYINSLEKIKIYSPVTEVSYSKETRILTFKQCVIKNDGQKFPHEDLIKALKNYPWGYGIDSNPNNFYFNNGRMINVDFFPFLIRDDSLLKEQFDYSVQIVMKRYFSAPNSIVSYIIRLFKIKPNQAMDLVKNDTKYLIDNYSDILPREKLRLSTAIDYFNKKKMNQFVKFYKDSKLVSVIDEITDKKLSSTLEQINLINIP